MKKGYFLMPKGAHRGSFIGYGDTEEMLFANIGNYLRDNLDDFEVVPLSDIVNSNDSLLEKANKILEVSKVSNVDGVSYNTASDTYEVNVEWGDWKNDHARLDLIFREALGLYKITENVTEQDGEDTYSSIHKFTTK